MPERKRLESLMITTARSKGQSATPRLTAAEERQRAIGARLRQLYDDVVREPIPDDFLRLLEEAERAESARAGDVDASEDSDVE